MYCSKCGKEITNDAEFCPNCGARQNKTVGDQINEVKEKVDELSQKIDKQVDSAVDDVVNNNTSSTEFRRLKTDRSLLAYILLSFITCGIYGFYFIYNLSQDINVACRDDGERTPGLGTYIILSFFTCGIYSLYWEYKIGNRIQANSYRYDLNIQENGTSILMWRIFGAIICFVGSFVGTNILLKNANAICKAYNMQMLNN